MAGQKEVSVGVKFTGDSKGFEKAAKQVQGSATALKKDIKQTTGIVDELSGAINGTVGQVGSLVSSLAVATGPIGALVAVVGALAAVWKSSQENIELYLKSADKLAAGSAGFDLDAEKAREETRKRANGMISEGYRIEKENMAKLTTYASLYTDEQKKHFTQLVREAQAMQENGRALRDSVVGLQDKTDWQIKYNGLLQEQERINDQGLVNREKWKGLDAELVKNREIIANKESTQADKAKAVVEAERIANLLLSEKNEFLDRQVASTRALSEMTATQELVEGNIADLLTEKNENIEKYHATMIKVDKMDTKATKEAQAQADQAERTLNALKKSAEIKRAEMSYQFVGRAVDTLQGKNKSKGKGTLATYSGSLADPEQLTSSLLIAQQAVQSLESSFQSMFTNVGGGFKGMIRSVMDSVKMLIAQLAAKAAILGLLQLLVPGSGMAVNALSGFRKFIGIPGFAGGTNFAPGGLALVGEHGPEVVNLPRGSRVTAAGKGGQTIKLVLDSKVKGRDLAMVLSRYAVELDTNT